MNNGLGSGLVTHINFQFSGEFDGPTNKQIPGSHAFTHTTRIQFKSSHFFFENGGHSCVFPQPPPYPPGPWVVSLGW